MAIFTDSPGVEGTVSGLGGLLPVASIVTATTIAMDTSHPNTNAAPLCAPCLDGSTTGNAVSGSSRALSPSRSGQVKNHGRTPLAPADAIVMLATVWLRPACT
jgi:hypothetical protein